MVNLFINLFLLDNPVMPTYDVRTCTGLLTELYQGQSCTVSVRMHYVKTSDTLSRHKFLNFSLWSFNKRA